MRSLRKHRLPGLSLLTSLSMVLAAGTGVGAFAHSSAPLYESLSLTESRSKTEATQVAISDLQRATALAIGDFDSDGRPDLAVVSMSEAGEGTVTVASDLRGFVRGRVEGPARRDLRFSGGADLAAAGDFDGDGRLDLVLARRGMAELRLLVGDGAGSFQLGAVTRLPGEIALLEVGEINRRDGLEDLAVVVETPTGWSVVLFEGPNGALGTEPERFALPGRPQEIFFEPLDDDPWMDMIAIGASETVVVYGRDRKLSYDVGRANEVEAARVELYEGARWPEGNRRASRPGVAARLNNDAIEDYVYLDSESLPVLLVSAPVTVYTVDSTGDGGDANTTDGVCDNGAGSCTLRAAIEQANANPGADKIEFNVGGGGAQTISPGSALPTITEGVEIDGTSQPGYAGSPLIELDGNGLGGNGLTITAGSSAVRALAIGRFGGSGIHLSSGGSNLVSGCHIGTDLAGTGDRGNGENGIHVVGSSGNTIGGTAPGERNLISGNTEDGVYVEGSGSTLNVIEGNYIGVDAQGDDQLANEDGVDFSTGPSNNTIGGTASGAGNVISGNAFNGVEMEGSTTTGNLMQGNTIGLDAGGTTAVPNEEIGVEIKNAPNNTIGGTVSGAGNVISGNTEDGVGIGFGDGSGDAATGNLIQGNLIGTDASGTGALPNDDGVAIEGVAANTVGGTVTGARNVISGNSRNGVSIREVGVSTGGNNNIVQGNYIGVDITGTGALANDDGVSLYGIDNDVGGLAEGAGNVISGNRESGVFVARSGNTVQGNLIGTNAAGTAAIGNAENGVVIQSSSNCLVGGTDPGASNVISGNGDNGIYIYMFAPNSFPASNNTVQGNFIGTDQTGTFAIANGLLADFGDGIELFRADDNTIGGTTAAARNVISGNDKEGIYIHNGSEGNVVQGNYIGTNAAGTAAIPNADDGVDIRETSNNTIGGTESGAGNLISGNTGDGIEVAGAGADLISESCPDLTPGASTSTGNVIQGNAIGANFNVTAALPNGGDGVEVEWANDTVIGGSAAGAANFIGGNSGNGVEIYCGSFGTDVEGNQFQENGADGVVIWDRAQNNTVSMNQIHLNGGLGIDLGNDGVTTNDPADPDAGANGLQNFPVLASVESGSTVVTGTLDSTPSTTFDIEIHSVLGCDPSGYGEGFYLGTFQATTNAGGLATFSETLAPDVPSGHLVTATATDPAGNTSEFSACVTPTVCLDGSVMMLTVDDTQVREACGTLTVGPDVTVEGPDGFLTLRGRDVVLTNDVDVATGGRLTIELTP